MPSQIMSASGERRSSKRKRAPVKYTYSELEDDIVLDDDDGTFEPQRKKTRKVAKPLPKHKIFPFMSLPAELRNKIYELALSDEGGVFITSRTKGNRRLAQRCIQSECVPQYRGRFWWGSGQRQAAEEEVEPEERRELVPNLVAASKAIHMEASSLLYSQPIAVADNYTLLAFLTQIGPKHTAMLRNLTIRQWCGGRAHKSINFPALAMLTPATGLRRLNIACVIGFFRYYGYSGKQQPVANRAAKKVFRDCYPFLEAYGRAHGKKDAGVELIELSKENFSLAKDVDAEMASFRQELSKVLMA